MRNLLAHNSNTSVCLLILNRDIDVLLLLARAQLDCGQQHGNKDNAREHKHVRVHVVDHLDNRAINSEEALISQQLIVCILRKFHWWIASLPCAPLVLVAAVPCRVLGAASHWRLWQLPSDILAAVKHITSRASSLRIQEGWPRNTLVVCSARISAWVCASWNSAWLGWRRSHISRLWLASHIAARWSWSLWRIRWPWRLHIVSRWSRSLDLVWRWSRRLHLWWVRRLRSACWSRSLYLW